jgi:hypothetical protein
MTQDELDALLKNIKVDTGSIQTSSGTKVLSKSGTVTSSGSK